MSAPPDDWIDLDLTRPTRHLREIAGLSQDGAAVALGLPPTPGSASTVTTPEQAERRGTVLWSTVLDRVRAYRLRIRVLVQRAE